jgi:hypothetical protein
MYAFLSEVFRSQNKIRVEVAGYDWNMASNASHFCDLTRWLSGESLSAVNCSEVDYPWRPSKRSGFLEFTGILRYAFSQGSELILESRAVSQGEDELGGLSVSVSSSEIEVHIEEGLGRLYSDELGYREFGPSPLQSALSFGMITEILKSGNSSLSRLDEAVKDESVFLSELLQHMRDAYGDTSGRLRVT